MKKLTLFVLSLGLTFGAFAQFKQLQGTGEPATIGSARSVTTTKVVKSSTAVKADKPTATVSVEFSEKTGMTASFKITFPEGTQYYAASFLRKGTMEQYDASGAAAYFSWYAYYYEQQTKKPYEWSVCEGDFENQSTWMMGGSELELAVVAINGTDTTWCAEPFDVPLYEGTYAGLATVDAEYEPGEVDNVGEVIWVNFELGESTYGVDYLLLNEEQAESEGATEDDNLEEVVKQYAQYFSQLQNPKLYMPLEGQNAFDKDAYYYLVLVPYNYNGEDGEYKSIKIFTGEEEVALINVTDYVVNVYPNPATEQVRLNSASKMNKVELVNSLGQVVYSADVNATSATINVANMEKGSYILRATTDKSEMTTKVIVK